MAMALFNVDEEASVPTWWSSAVLGMLGLLTAVVGSEKAESRTALFAWWALAAAFGLMSLDEVAMLHERAGYLVDNGGALHYARWILVWLPVAALLGIPIVWQLWQSSRRLVIGLIIGAFVFLSGAVGTEMVNSMIRYESRAALQAGLVEGTPRTESERTIAAVDAYADKQTFGYQMGVAVEELLEMLGAVLWLAVVLEAGLRSPKTQPVHTRPASAEFSERLDW